jgi:uncharacterized membrane protein
MWIALVLGLLGIVVLRARGLLAVACAGLSILLLATFVVPAILTGEPALLVALGVLCALALFCIGAAHLDGHSTDLSLVLSQQNTSLSLKGVVLAGMVVGGLGVLADTAVTQASAVMALRRADPAMNPRSLYRASFAVGRDHLSATIHTLVLRREDERASAPFPCDSTFAVARRRHWRRCCFRLQATSTLPAPSPWPGR